MTRTPPERRPPAPSRRFRPSALHSLHPAMFAKLLVIIVAVALTAAALLVIRQQRIDTSHEIAQLHRQLFEHEATLWMLRGRLAQRCRPDLVRDALQDLDADWTPIPAPEAAAADGRCVEFTAHEPTERAHDPSPGPATR